jgi:hypothetical protein
MGEVPSVRMVLPMDMKNLASLSNEFMHVPSKSGCVPESGGRTSHVLTQGSQHSIGTRTESDDVGCAKDETDDETDT